MKKLALALTVFPFLLSTANAEIVEGETSTIHFTGKIVESTCTLNTGSKGQDIGLGTIASNTFLTPGTTSLETKFTIELEDCSTAYENAKIKFRGDTMPGNSTRLNVNGGATNVGIEILENNAPLDLDGSSSSGDKVLGSGTNIFNFAARYVSTGSVVGVGEANANVNFTVEYE